MIIYYKATHSRAENGCLCAVIHTSVYHLIKENIMEITNFEMPGYTTVGKRIRYYREACGLTQKALAGAAGINESTVRNYELGNRIPDDMTLMKLAHCMRITFESLLDPSNRTPEEILHFFLRCEDIYGLHPEIIDGKVYLALGGGDDCDTESSNYKDMEQHLIKWYEAIKTLKSNDLASYYKWRCKYPEYAHIDEDGGLVSDDDTDTDVPSLPSNTDTDKKKRKRKINNR